MPHAQMLTFGLDDGPSGSVNQYLSVTGCGEVATWTSTEGEHGVAFPTAGTLTNWFIQRASGPGVGSTSVYRIRKNLANTSMTLSFTGTETYKQSLYKETVAAGDVITLVHEPSVSPTASEAWGVVEFRPTNPAESVMLGGTGDVSLGLGARYCALHAIANPASILFDVETLITDVRGGIYGVVTKLHVVLETAPTGVTASRTFEIYKNGAGTGVSLTITGAAKTGSTTGSITVNDGDRLALYATATNAPSASKAWYGIVIEPEYQNEYLMNGCASGTLPTGGAYEYNRISTGNAAWTATKLNRSRSGATWGHYAVCIGLRVSRAPDTADPASSNKAYELYLENPSAGGERAYVLDNATYAKSAAFHWGARRFNTWNVRALAFNTPASANAQWCLQMRHYENHDKGHM